MRSLLFALLCLFLISGCGDDGGGNSGGSGDIVNFSFDCDSPAVDCPGAKVRGRSWGDGVKETKCAWNCALNTTDYKESGFEDLTEPARHIITLRKVGDNCWRVYDVDTDACGKALKECSSWDNTSGCDESEW